MKESDLFISTPCHTDTPSLLIACLSFYFADHSSGLCPEPISVEMVREIVNRDTFGNVESIYFETCAPLEHIITLI